MNFIIFLCATLILFSFSFVSLLARNPGEANDYQHTPVSARCYKKLSYRRETARQLPTCRGARPSSPLPLPGYIYASG